MSRSILRKQLVPCGAGLERALVNGGMDDAKVARVVGLSSAVLFDKSNPFNPINRRISIIVLNKETEDAILNDDGKLEQTTAESEQPAVNTSSAPTSGPSTSEPAAAVKTADLPPPSAPTTAKEVPAKVVPATAAPAAVSPPPPSPPAKPAATTPPSSAAAAAAAAASAAAAKAVSKP